MNKPHLKPLPSPCFPSHSSVSSSHLPFADHSPPPPLRHTEETIINIIFVQQKVCIPHPSFPPFFLFPSFSPPPIAFQRSADHRRRKMGQHNEDDDCRGKAYCNPQHKNSNGLSPSPPAPLRSPSPAGVVERKSIPIQITFPVYRFPLLVPS
ncbi:hypothetical protein niasHT_010489 [Heterodera trifolii]|uniref:Uncharacterized protein n=1 Tax=Heterodera trifolii TaxID=157864 RepID=A0ABD2L369_9BILA